MLVVEDDPPTREFLRDVLQTSLYAVVAVEDGIDALRYLEGDTPDVIVLDLDLPRLHGRDVHRELNAQGLTARVPVIVVTGSDAQIPAHEVSAVIRKPVDPDLLCAAIDRATRKSFQQDV